MTTIEERLTNMQSQTNATTDPRMMQARDRSPQGYADRAAKSGFSIGFGSVASWCEL